MRVEGDEEVRIYCENVEGCPIHIITEGVLNLFADLCDDVPREAHATSEQWGVTSGQRDSNVAEQVRNKPGKRLHDGKMLLQIWFSWGHAGGCGKILENS
jgi:hypothetical protein